MSESHRATLTERGVIRVTGDDAREFLQGLISNDIRRVAPGRAIYAALLTPQGKYLFDFFIAEADGALLIDCERARLADLIKRLSLYKLRAKATLEDVSESYRVVAVWGAGSLDALGLGPDAGAARDLRRPVQRHGPVAAEIHQVPVDGAGEAPRDALLEQLVQGLGVEALQVRGEFRPAHRARG